MVIERNELALTERHVIEGEAHLARVRQIIAELESSGQDTIDAWELLQTLEKSQALHIAVRDQLRALVDARPDGQPTNAGDYVRR